LGGDAHDAPLKLLVANKLSCQFPQLDNVVVIMTEYVVEVGDALRSLVLLTRILQVL